MLYEAAEHHSATANYGTGATRTFFGLFRLAAVGSAIAVEKVVEIGLRSYGETVVGALRKCDPEKALPHIQRALVNEETAKQATTWQGS